MEDNRQEDLDLLYVFKSIKNAILKFFAFFKFLIDFSIKKIIPLSLFIVFSTSLSLGLYFLTTPYYKSEMAISHIRFENDYCYKMLKNLADVIDGEDNNALSQVLGISPKYTKEVKSITYYPLNRNIASRYEDSASVVLPFNIEVGVYNTDILDSLQKGILNYLESNEYATKIKELDEEILIKTEEELKKEIISIDSLKDIVNRSVIPRNTGNGMIFGEPIDPVSVYKQSIEMHEKANRLNKQKKINNSFEVRVGFSKTNKKASPNRLTYVFFGILIGYSIGLIYLLRKQSKSTN